MSMFTELRLIGHLKAEVATAGSQKALAKRIGVSEQFLSEVLRGRRSPGPRVLQYLGVERVVSYRKVPA